MSHIEKYVPKNKRKETLSAHRQYLKQIITDDLFSMKTIEVKYLVKKIDTLDSKITRITGIKPNLA